MLVLSLSILCANNKAAAGSRFTSTYPCVDAGKYCVSSGMRKVDGFDVSKDCWEYAYVKTCNYPSKNDCRLYEHCYAVANRECLLKDSLGNCVNPSWYEIKLKDRQHRGYKGSKVSHRALQI